MKYERTTIWVRTAPDLESKTYHVVIEFDDDTSHSLTSQTAVVYATTILAAVARAEYDAAVARQLTGIGGGTPVSRQNAAILISELRDGRHDIDWPTPLQLEPGVSASTGDPFLRVVISDRIVGQWTPADAVGHAADALAAVEAAELDGEYLRRLLDMGISEPKARAAVEGIGVHRG